MNKIKDTEEILATTGKAAYVKPAIEVYEMEVEQCILVDSTPGNPSGYPYGDGWSKAETGLHDNVFNA